MMPGGVTCDSNDVDADRMFDCEMIVVIGGDEDYT